MAQAKKPTRIQKEILQGHGLNWREYVFVEQVNDSYMKFKNRETGMIKIVDVYKRSKHRFDY